MEDSGPAYLATGQAPVGARRGGEAREINTAASCTLMQKFGQEIFFLRSSETNLKIMTVEDLRIFEALLHTKQESWLKSDLTWGNE
nr:hypothetical protein [Thermophilibacter immobilis]